MTNFVIYISVTFRDKQEQYFSQRKKALQTGGPLYRLFILSELPLAEYSLYFSASLIDAVALHSILVSVCLDTRDTYRPGQVRDATGCEQEN